jgi:thiol-disulfide isomerase/thioredoxin
MRQAPCLLACLCALAALAGLLPSRPLADTRGPAKTVKPFTLRDPAGKAWSLADQKDKKAVVVLFLGTECPINNAYLPRLAELHRAYAEKGVAFVGVNSNVHDTATRIAAHAGANAIPFPVLKDAANVVADDFGARRTPEAFVLSAGGKVLYQGRIDDQFGVGFKRKEPTRRDLAAALDEVLAGKAVSKPLTEVAGCLIARAVKPRETGTVTYSKHVARILQDRCQECHRPGQVAPMSLLSYEDALSWQEMIREVLEEGRMPPWHADPKFGKFANDRSLAKAERQALLDWVKQGCPKGDEKDLPGKKEWVKGWRIGKPDAVFTMPAEFTVPAETPKGGVPYKHFVVPTGYDEDRWVVAAEARPGAREVVHHIIVYIADPSRLGRKPGGARGARGEAPGTALARQDGIGNGFLTAFAPGDMPLTLEPGQAKKLPKGSVLVFQMHYTPDGVQRKDRSSVGLVFAKEPPKREVRTRAVAQRYLKIPPGESNYEARSVSAFDKDVELLNLFPHMHLRGKDFKYEAVYPNGKRETLLSVPRYDFGWQSTYRLARPLRLPAGSRIECTAHYDNSAGNPNNPDPKELVRWGDQTWEEMMIGFVDYSFMGVPGKK